MTDPASERLKQRDIQLSLLEGQLMAVRDLEMGLVDVLQALRNRKYEVMAAIKELAPEHDHG